MDDKISRNSNQLINSPLFGITETLRTTTATPTKTSLENVNFFAFLPICSTGTMWPNYLGTELVGAVFKFKNEMKNSPSCASLDLVISHCCFSEEGKEID